MQRIHFGINPLELKNNLVTTLKMEQAPSKDCLYKKTEGAGQEAEMLNELDCN